ncbi:30S ribosomal protein S6 alpha chloroplastic [Bienertia sinuspersici]
MATFSLTSTLPSSSPTSLHSISSTHFLPSNFNFTHSLKPFQPKPKPTLHQPNNGPNVKALALDFSGSFFEGGFSNLDEDPPSTPPSGLGVEEKPEPQCPPGLRQYETMAVLRPDMTEDERLSLTRSMKRYTFSFITYSA